MRAAVLLYAVVLCVAAAATATAQPQVEGIAFGWEEEVVHVADLPATARAALKIETDLDFAVGFAYRRAYLFSGSFSFWHWRGRYVLFSGRNLLEIQPAALQQLLGNEQFADLRPPLAYRLPAGLITVVLLIVVGLGVRYLMPSQTARVQRLLQDPGYAAACEVYAATLPNPEEETTAGLRRQALQTAIDFLSTEKSIAPAEAEVNLKMIVSLQEEYRSKQLRQQALAHEMAGEWDDALDLYEEAAELREVWDPQDFAFLQKCIQRVEQKQAAANRADE